jgi:hypothetical protein
VDLNFDGTANTDLSQEFTCVWGNYQYFVEISLDGLTEKGNAYFNVATIVLYNDVNNYDRIPTDEGCFFYWVKYYGYELVDTSTMEFQFSRIYPSGGKYLWEGLFGVLKKLYLQDNHLYLEYEKDFYTPDGWQTTNCYFEFAKKDN